LHTVDTACATDEVAEITADRGAHGRPGTPAGSIQQLGPRVGPIRANRSQEVCADRRLLDIGADQNVHISHAQGRPSPPATESGVLQSRCITPYAPHVLVVYLVTHHLSTYLLRPMVRASVTHHGSGASSLTARAAMRVRMLEAATSPTPLPVTGGALAMPRRRGTGQLSGGSGRGSGTSWHRRHS
jgi:hypothetical protein